MGRLWNEGLAYYGWIFYMSKFYEVLDTFIIIAKGKPSSTLQTYHHAGAMLSMWAGMRYMSAPIWLFVLFNSFIHALMYTYYTATTLSTRVPVLVKRTLTTMQISQFIVGASLAMLNSFIYYYAPVASATTSADPAVAVKSVHAIFGSGSGADSRYAATVADTDESYVLQACIVTSAETFAIWLNVAYLAPLTYLFVSFFIARYVKHGKATNRCSGKDNAVGRLSNVTADVAVAKNAGWAPPVASSSRCKATSAWYARVAATLSVGLPSGARLAAAVNQHTSVLPAYESRSRCVYAAAYENRSSLPS
ncbi:hypothetical protein NLG97_g953 [Lecanicillium saksenae]|uniref:Uncharacterized protein n=1 Tax=Lecanicillium saksenae TaxID=468837 RepID=A0ACC1R7S7_9HYPO|nr:hypothetical protein NLG97_g953 [Lecanicillium saksenae]